MKKRELREMLKTYIALRDDLAAKVAELEPEVERLTAELEESQGKCIEWCIEWREEVQELAGVRRSLEAKEMENKTLNRCLDEARKSAAANAKEASEQRHRADRLQDGGAFWACPHCGKPPPAVVDKTRL